MDSKWYLSTIFLFLAFIGISLQENAVPNQEIVVQFTNDKISDLNTESTIEIVKNQLQELGADKIQVHQIENGKIKITYLSDVTVASIKKVFSEKKKLHLKHISLSQQKENSSLPQEDSSNKFKLDVFEIKKDSDKKNESRGLASELIPETERFSNPNAYCFSYHLEISIKNRLIQSAFKNYRNNSIEIDNSSSYIPEVRAGPLLS